MRGLPLAFWQTCKIQATRISAASTGRPFGYAYPAYTVSRQILMTLNHRRKRSEQAYSEQNLLKKAAKLMPRPEISVSPEIRQSVSRTILDGIERLVQDAQKATQPLEVDPWRSQLFELFVTADGANLIGDERSSGLRTGEGNVTDETDLSADGLCRSLARRWGLDMAARDSAAQQSKLPADHLEKMRLLWSVMRMWMEWNYAWCRWEEFHSQNDQPSAEAP